MSLKEGLIRQTEQAINEVVKRREMIQRELETISAEEKEAREMLQLLKTGSSPKGSSNSNRLSEDQVLEVIADLPDEFTNPEFAAALGCSKDSARPWGEKMVEAGILTYLYKGVPRSSRATMYRKVK